MGVEEVLPTWVSGQLEEQQQKGLAGWHVNPRSTLPIGLGASVSLAWLRSLPTTGSIMAKPGLGWAELQAGP